MFMDNDIDFAMFDLAPMDAAAAAARKDERARKATAARHAYRGAERDGAEDPRVAARKAAAKTL